MKFTLELQSKIFNMWVYQEWDDQLTLNQTVWVVCYTHINDLDILHRPWLSTLILKVNLLNSWMSGTGWQINMQRNGYESIGFFN